MAKPIVDESGFKISKSYDIGVHFSYRDILKNDPLRTRYFKQNLARLDNIYISHSHDYETGKSQKRGDLQGNEVYYYEIQQMIDGARLPLEKERELYDHLDYIMNAETNSINFLKVKEFFAFCGVSGVYDLENKKHFLMDFDPPYAVKNLKFNKWEDKFEKNREIFARMMAQPGEVPDHKKAINDLTLERDLLWGEAFMATDLYTKLIAVSDQVVRNARNGDGNILRAIAEGKKNGLDIDVYDEEIAEFTREFDKRADATSLQQKIDHLVEDEATKLKAALSKYAPQEWMRNDDPMSGFDKLLGDKGKTWDFNQDLKLKTEVRKWAKLYIGHDSYKTVSNEPPTDGELPRMRSGLVKRGLYNKARYNMMVEEFENKVWPVIRSRCCAIKDWALRDYTMNAINRGVLAEARREDIPKLFLAALRDELSDGLLTKLQFPTRIEQLQDGSGNCKLVLHGHDVELFHPNELLPEAEHIAQPYPFPTPDPADSPAPQIDKSELTDPIENQEKALDFKIKASTFELGEGAPEAPELSRQNDNDHQLKKRADGVKRDISGRNLKGSAQLGQQKAQADEYSVQQSAPRGFPGGYNPGASAMNLELPNLGIETVANTLGKLRRGVIGSPENPGAWSHLKNGLVGTKEALSKVVNIDEDGLEKIGKELKKISPLFKKTYDNELVNKLSDECKKLVENMVKAIQQMLDSLFSRAGLKA